MKKFVIPVLLAVLLLGGGNLGLLFYSAGHLTEALSQETEWVSADGGSIRPDEESSQLCCLPKADGTVLETRLGWREQYAEGLDRETGDVLFSAGLRYRPDGRLLLLIESDEAGLSARRYTFRRAD